MFNLCNKSARRWSASRLLVLGNLFLFLIYSAVYMYDGVYTKLRVTNLADPIAWGVYLWIAGTTLFATGLFLRDLIRAWRGSGELQARSTSLAVDAALLVVWWVALLAVIAYAFMLGMGG